MGTRGPREPENKTEAALPSPGVLLIGLALCLSLSLLNPYALDLMVSGLSKFQPRLWRVFIGLYVVLASGALALVWNWRRAGRTRFAQLLFNRFQAVGGLCIALAMITAVLSVTEFTFWRLNVSRSKEVIPWCRGNQQPALFLPDPELGWHGPANTVVHDLCVETPGGATIYEKDYTLGPKGYRVVPQPTDTKSSHLVVFGCSFSFGIGCADDETFPARLAAKKPEVHVYNYAFPAYGPGQVLLQLEQSVLDDVAEGPGAAVFQFMCDHPFRVVPKWSHLDWSKDFPAFELDAQGTPQRIGTLTTAYPWRIECFKLLAKEQFVQWMHIDPPMYAGASEFALCAGILAKARDLYRERFPDNEFYVLVEPICYAQLDHEKLALALRSRGLPVLEAKGVYGSAPRLFQYRFDRHPKPEAYVKLADWFWEQFPQGIVGHLPKASS